MHSFFFLIKIILYMVMDSTKVSDFRGHYLFTNLGKANAPVEHRAINDPIHLR